MKAQYPLLAARAVTAPTPTTLWITNDCLEMAETPRVIGRAFQTMIEEARAAPDVVASMCLLLLLSVYFRLCL